MSTLIAIILPINFFIFSYQCCILVKKGGFEMHVDYNLIGTRIKSARKAVGMTQENLAERLDVSIGYISQVERGITKISLDLLAEISDILNRDISFFVCGTNFSSDKYMEQELIREYSNLSYKNKRLVFRIIGLLEENDRTND